MEKPIEGREEAGQPCKWTLIESLRSQDDPYGTALVELMDFCGAMNLREITEEQVRSYCAMKKVKE